MCVWCSAYSTQVCVYKYVKNAFWVYVCVSAKDQNAAPAMYQWDYEWIAKPSAFDNTLQAQGAIGEHSLSDRDASHEMLLLLASHLYTHISEEAAALYANGIEQTWLGLDADARTGWLNYGDLYRDQSASVRPVRVGRWSQDRDVSSAASFPKCVPTITTNTLPIHTRGVPIDIELWIDWHVASNNGLEHLCTRLGGVGDIPFAGLPQTGTT